MRQISLVSVVVLLLCSPLWSAAAPTTAPSMITYRQQLVDLFLQRLTSKSRFTGTPWEKPGEAILKQTAQAMANERIDRMAWPTGSPTPEALCELADEVRKAGCDDPSILFCCMRAYVRNWRDGDARAIASTLKPVGSRQVPGLIVFAIKDELANLASELAEWSDIAPQRTASLFTFVSGSSNPMNSGQVRLTLALLLEEAQRNQSAEGGANAILNRAVSAPRASQWLKEVIQAEQEIDRAWEARGTRLAAEVPADAWPVFFKHLTSASEHLNAAVKLNPELPEAWGDQIIVAMATSQPIEGPFDHGLDAEIDNPQVWSATQFALLPRWGGSYSRMLQAGMQGIKSDRYDTLAPYRFVNAVELIDKDMTQMEVPSTIWQEQRTADHALDVVESYIKASQGTDVAQLWLEKLEDVADKAERYERVLDAETRLSALEAKRAPSTRPTSMPSELFDRLSPRKLLVSKAHGLHDHGDAVREILQLMDTEKWPDAAAKIDQLSANMGSTDPARLFVANLHWKASAQVQLDTRNWTDITPRQEMFGWHIMGGEWRWFDQSVHAMSDDRPIRVSSDISLRGPIEVAATLLFDRPTCDNHAGVGLTLHGKGGAGPIIEMPFYPLYGMLKYGDTAGNSRSLDSGSTAKLDLKISLDADGISVTMGKVTKMVGDRQAALALISNPLYLDVVQEESRHLPIMRVSIQEIRARQLQP